MSKCQVIPDCRIIAYYVCVCVNVTAVGKRRMPKVIISMQMHKDASLTDYPINSNLCPYLQFF